MFKTDESSNIITCIWIQGVITMRQVTQLNTGARVESGKGWGSVRQGTVMLPYVFGYNLIFLNMTIYYLDLNTFN